MKQTHRQHKAGGQKQNEYEGKEERLSRSRSDQSEHKQPKYKLHQPNVAFTDWQIFSHFSDGEEAGGHTPCFTLWPFLLRHLLPPITPPLCLSPSPRVQLWNIVFFDDLTSLSLRRRRTDTPRPQSGSLTDSFKADVSIRCDGHDEDLQLHISLRTDGSPGLMTVMETVLFFRFQ